MRHRSSILVLWLAALLSAPTGARAVEVEEMFGEWTVETVSPTTVRASTQGTKVAGHMFALLASASSCEEPLFWISWSAQGPDKPELDQFESGAAVQLAIDASAKTARFELPLVAAQPLTPGITVFALTNVVVPKDLLDALSEAEKVNVTVEKPEWLASRLEDPDDAFSLSGFAPALEAMTQRCSAVAEAAACPGVELTVRHWFGLVEGPSAPRTKYLAQLGACTAQKPEFRARVDYVAVEALEALEAVPEESQSRWTELVAEVLRRNGNAGEEASQQNLASMYHAPPGSTLAKVFPQDPGRFLYWTRSAASRGEPRALFNLAVRLAEEDAAGGDPTDPALAYQALLALGRMIVQYEPQLDELRSAVETVAQELEKKLGEKRVEALREAAGTFSLAVLAPTGGEPALRTGK